MDTEIEKNKDMEQDEYNEKSIQESRIALNNIVKQYLDSNPVLKPNGVAKEFEIRFGSMIML